MTTSTKYYSSPVPWAGGKWKNIEKCYKQYFPQDITHVIEPFAGGASVSFWLQQDRDEELQIILGDTNWQLMAFYETLKNWPNFIAKQWEYDKGNNSKEYFDRKRSIDPRKVNSYEVASRFFYLIRTCFNSLWRENARGEFNVPHGHLRNISTDHIHQTSSLLSSAILNYSDYRTTIGTYAHQKSLVFLDPPYLPLSTTSDFTSYTRDKWGIKDQEALMNYIESLTYADIPVMLCSNDVPLVRKRYQTDPEYTLIELESYRSVGASADSRKQVGELLIINRPCYSENGSHSPQ